MIPDAALLPVVAPDSDQVCRVTPQLSPVVGARPFTTAEQTPASVDWLTFAGHVIVGFSLSVTITVKLQVAEFPAASSM